MIVAAAEHHAKETGARVEAAYKSLDKAENMMKSAGYMLEEAHTKCKTEWNITFREYCSYGHFQKTRAYECLQVYRGQKTVEDLREKEADKKRVQRERAKSEPRPGRPGHESSTKSTTEDQPKAKRNELIEFILENKLEIGDLSLKDQREIIKLIKEKINA